MLGFHEDGLEHEIQTKISWEKQIQARQQAQDMERQTMLEVIAWEQLRKEDLMRLQAVPVALPVGRKLKIT